MKDLTTDRRIWWLVGGLTLVALILHLMGQSTRILWIDEACTYWTIQESPLAILGGARTDGSPPLYFVLVWLSSTVLGSGELALRAPSLLAAVALVPGLFWVGRRIASERAALFAAGLATVSPLIHYYSVEARNYTLMQLLVVPVLASLLAALEQPGRWQRWALVSGTLALLLYTHNWAVFLLPAPAIAALATASTERIVVALRAFGASVAAFVLYLPWYPVASKSAEQGVGDWIVRFWEKTPPAATLFRSLEVFGFGGAYPEYLSYLGRASTSLRGLSIAVTVILLGTVAWQLRDSTKKMHRILIAFLLVPLIVAIGYSYAVQPVYLVGRYDSIALPAFLLLGGIGVDSVLLRASRVGWLLPIGILVLSFVSMGSSFGKPVADTQNLLAVKLLQRDLREGDVVVTLGLRRAVTEYYLHRSDRRPTIYSYPPEIAEHPGWYSPNRILSSQSDFDELTLKGKVLADQLASGGAHGKSSVWVLLSNQQPPIDNTFLKPLQEALGKPTVIRESGVARFSR